MLLLASGQLYEQVAPKRASVKHESWADREYALAAILKYYQMEQVEVPHDLENEDAFSYMIRKSGLMMRRVVLENDWWKQASLPMIVTAEDETLALLPVSNGTYMEMTENGLVKLTADRIKEIGTIGYCFYRPISPEKSDMKSFWGFLFQSLTKTDLVMIAGISILLELCGLILPYINQIVYNNVIPSGTAREIPGIVVLVISSVVFSSLIGLTRNVSVTRIGAKMRLAGQSAIWNRLFSLPMSFLKKYDAGELYNRANAVGQICDILGGGLIPAALTALLSVIYLVQISWFAAALVTPSVIIIALMLLNIAASGFLQIRWSRAVSEENNKVTGFLYQMIGGVTKIRTAGAEVRAYAKWSEVWRRVPLLPPVFLQVTGILGTAISLGGSIVLYWIAWKSQIGASSYIAFQTAFASFSMAVMALADFGARFGALRPSVDMVRPIIEEKPELCGDRKFVGKLEGEIELSQVKFRYTPDMPYVLDGMNLHIKAGEYVGIVGSSGCGKSTLMRILLGFETAENGTVYFDGNDIRGMDLPSLRRRIGVVLQNGSLFAGDIYSNIAICAPELTMEEAWEAAERAGVDKDIENMPMGMYTMLSEDGGGVSGGQKQRILIARAIASDPDILLFDEATSALDNWTQGIVVETIRNMKCTRIVIAHRLSTIRDCDRIIYLDRGHIMEEGNYEELMAQNGAFAKMAERQLT